MSSARFVAAIVVFGAAVVGCEQPTEPSPNSVAIVFPLDDARFSAEHPVTFHATHEAEWTSSRDGQLGTGRAIERILSPGTHTIRAARRGAEATVRLSVVADVSDQGVRVVSIQSRLRRVYLAHQHFELILVGLGPGSRWVRVRSGSGNPVAAARLDAQHSDLPVRDTPIEYPPNLASLVSVFHGPIAPRTIESAADPQPSVGATRSFHLSIPTAAGASRSLTILASLCFAGDHVRVWLDDTDRGSQTRVEELAADIDARAVPRTIALWGTPLDVDGDGRLAVLVTSELNRGGYALGAFNPADLFPRVSDPDDEAFNPTSNQSDIIYLALPGPPDAATEFSFDSILATAAHEAFHAVSFSTRVLGARTHPTSARRPLDLFLEEGFAHLTENLVGYGVTGGNVLFVERYLAAPHDVSLSGSDRFGRGDSVARRGGVSLLLSYLMQRARGVDSNPETVAEAIDPGGVSFLRAVLNSPHTGWAALEQATGATRNDLLLDFGLWLGGAPQPPASAGLIDPWMGSGLSLGREYRLAGPGRSDAIFAGVDVLESSLFFSTRAHIDPGNGIEVEAESGGRVLAGFLPVRQ